eukprot:1538882-Prymnesium_polylepis.2
MCQSRATPGSRAGCAKAVGSPDPYKLAFRAVTLQPNNPSAFARGGPCTSAPTGSTACGARSHDVPRCACGALGPSP